METVATALLLWLSMQTVSVATAVVALTLIPELFTKGTVIVATEVSIIHLLAVSRGNTEIWRKQQQMD